ncbi:hypothetical protein RhiirA4_462351 [Rhizophagus irregularis]|uniref:Uncharacterized protein n=1 Tax=Rhizophagus irregularis TaxID=588596 RepID=A0A2I1GKT5_9GLOM|nr:hypothetical protein RhiirA4_462351 [Rhizophagus irregularis]
MLINAFKSEVIEENGKIGLMVKIEKEENIDKEIIVGEIGGVEIIDDKKIIIKGLKISYGVKRRKIDVIIGKNTKKYERPSAPPPLPGPCKDYINKCFVAYHACINGINSPLYENELKQCNINCSLGSCLDLSQDPSSQKDLGSQQDSDSQ